MMNSVASERQRYCIVNWNQCRRVYTRGLGKRTLRSRPDSEGSLSKRAQTYEDLYLQILIQDLDGTPIEISRHSINTWTNINWLRSLLLPSQQGYAVPALRQTSHNNLRAGSFKFLSLSSKHLTFLWQTSKIRYSGERSIKKCSDVRFERRRTESLHSFNSDFQIVDSNWTQSNCSSDDGGLHEQWASANYAVGINSAAVGNCERDYQWFFPYCQYYY